MNVEYKNKHIEKVCTNASAAMKEYGLKMAEKIQQRIQEIEGAPNVEFMIQYGIGRCHPLRGNRNNQYAVDLIHPKRLVFTKKGSEIQIVIINEIVDYH